MCPKELLFVFEFFASFELFELELEFDIESEITVDVFEDELLLLF
jgi:hypothetical protein